MGYSMELKKKILWRDRSRQYLDINTVKNLNFNTNDK